MGDPKTDAKTAWSVAGERFTGLGRTLKQRYNDERAGDGGDQERQDVKDAVGKLGAALEDVFDAMGSAVKDPAVKDEVKQVGQSLAGAVGVTFAEVSEELRKTFNRGHAGSSDPVTPVHPTATEPAAPQYGTPENGPTEPGPTEPGPTN